jgi:hypothetical protein
MMALLLSPNMQVGPSIGTPIVRIRQSLVLSLFFQQQIQIGVQLSPQLTVAWRTSCLEFGQSHVECPCMIVHSGQVMHDICIPETH